MDLPSSLRAVEGAASLQSPELSEPRPGNSPAEGFLPAWWLVCLPPAWWSVYLVCLILPPAWWSLCLSVSSSCLPGGLSLSHLPACLVVSLSVCLILPPAWWSVCLILLLAWWSVSLSHPPACLVVSQSVCLLPPW